jgi:hypothetical protein
MLLLHKLKMTHKFLNLRHHLHHHLRKMLKLHLHQQQLHNPTILVPGCVVNGVDAVLVVRVHFPNEVGLTTPMIPPLGDPI